MSIKYLLVLVIISNIAFAKIYTIDITPSFSKDRFNHIKILDQKDLAISTIDGYKFSEISDLAYLKSKHILYMVSDEGVLYLFDATFDDKISKLKPIKAVELRKKMAKSLNPGYEIVRGWHLITKIDLSFLLKLDQK